MSNEHLNGPVDDMERGEYEWDKRLAFTEERIDDEAMAMFMEFLEMIGADDSAPRSNFQERVSDAIKKLLKEDKIIRLTMIDVMAERWGS